MDLREIARSQRRRHASDALEFEREREAALREQLEETVTELEGPAIDEEVFSRMAPEDAELVKQALFDPNENQFEEGFEEGWLDDLDGDSAEDDRAERLGEVARLEAEIGRSQLRQQALERYLEALAGPEG